MYIYMFTYIYMGFHLGAVGHRVLLRRRPPVGRTSCRTQRGRERLACRCRGSLGCRSV